MQAVADGRFAIDAKGTTPTISVFDTIEPGFTARIAGALRSIGDRPVLVEINSRGGDFFEGLGAFNLLARHTQPVTSQIVELAASAASVVAMAGDTIEIFKSATMMIHNASGVAIGNRHSMLEFAAVLEQLDGTMAQLYAARSGADAAAIGRLMDAESFIGAEDAVAMGLADAVVNKQAAPAPQAATSIAPRDKRELEDLLRGAGFSRAAAGRMTSAAWAARQGENETADLDLSAVAAAMSANFRALKPYV